MSQYDLPITDLRKNKAFILILSIMSLILLTQNVYADSGDRVALLIANEDYRYNENDLKNPVNDADLLAGKLKNLGFKVKVLKNGDRVAMHQAIDNFGKQSRNAQSAVFYYSGHGMQNKHHNNFLIPVDANITNDDSISYSAVNMQKVIDKLEQANPRVSLVMLDACRNNKFLGTKGSRNFAVVPYKIDSDGEMLVSYATKSGEVALDGRGRNSPYTIAVADQLNNANEFSVQLMFHNVREQVKKATNNDQNPEITIDMGYYTNLFGIEVMNTKSNIQSATHIHKPINPFSYKDGYVNGNFVVHDNGTATDTSTDLVWARCNLGATWDGKSCIGNDKEYTWNEAFKAIDKMNHESYGGHSDWKIPNIEELYSVIYCSTGFYEDDNEKIPLEDGGYREVKQGCNSMWGGGYQTPTINLSVFPDSGGWYWSSTPDKADKNFAWEGNFAGGFVQSYAKSGKKMVHPVRMNNSK